MRSYDLRISADVQLFNSRTDLQEGEPIVTAIHGIKPAGDDRIGMLYEYSSGRDAVEDHLANVPTVDTDEVQWAEHGDNTLVYSAREPVGPAAELLETLFSSPVVVEYPITVTPADDLLVTLAGDDEHLKALVRADTPTSISPSSGRGRIDRTSPTRSPNSRSDSRRSWSSQPNRATTATPAGPPTRKSPRNSTSLTARWENTSGRPKPASSRVSSRPICQRSSRRRRRGTPIGSTW